MRLAEVVKLAEDPAVWNDPKRAQDLGRERKTLESLVTTMARLDQDLRDTAEIFAMARGENDDATLRTIEADALALEKTVVDVEFRRMFSNPMDPNNCFVDIQAGQGGTEAQDWTQTLERMYMRYCERKGFRVELLEESPGDVAGLKVRAESHRRLRVRPPAHRKPASTAWYANRRSTPTTGGTRHSPAYSSESRNRRQR